VGEVEVPAHGTGIGTIGLGSGPGSGSTGPGSGSTGSGFGGRGKSVPRVRQSKAAVTGSLDKDIIRRIVRAHINEVRYCYNQGLTRDPALAGKVSIQFTIAASGKVSVATVADSTLSDENVANCIAKAVKRWTFPKPTGGGVVVVTYPFVLEPG
jgi:outer membrane biosynthesis protein TonB